MSLGMDISVGHKQSSCASGKNRLVLFDLDNNAHTTEYFNQSFVLKFIELYKFNLCCYIYKILKH